MQTFTQIQKQSQKTSSSRRAQPNQATSVLDHRQALTRCQRDALGNQAKQTMLRAVAVAHPVGSTSPASPHSEYAFNRISIHPAAERVLQTRPPIITSGGKRDQAPNQVADVINGSHESQIVAQEGFAGPARPLPHLERIQSAFGSVHDLSKIRAHTDAAAKQATQRLSAWGFTFGNEIAFQGEPSLHLAAHEAAHVVQQRSGVLSAVGVESTDAWEQHADAVAGPLRQEQDHLTRAEQEISTDLPQAQGTRIVNTVLSSPGQPLSPTIRSFMESRFNRNFASVRVHTDLQAQRSAQEMHAQAYTVGRDIVFGADQYIPNSPTGQALLAHELVHTLQSGLPPRVLLRQPKGKSRPNPPKKRVDPEFEIQLRPRQNEIDIVFSDFMFEQDVLPIVFKAGKLPPGFTLVGSAGASITTRWVLTTSSSQDISSASNLLNERLVTRLADQRTKQGAIEQSEAARQLQEPIREARTRFRKRHEDHGETVLNNIDAALQRLTQNNPNLLVAYYDYYADQKLTDELENKGRAGATSSGDTDIDARVLGLNSVFKTSDPLSFLGETLIHEYVHTPQGPLTHAVELAIGDAKAYAVELFFAERMGDEKRAEVIYKLNSNVSVDTNLGTDKIYRDTYKTLQALYQIIDSGRTQSDARIAGDISAEEARRMSVEFISKNEKDYSTKLKEFIATHSR